jgi:FkbM family methyltransferase
MADRQGQHGRLRAVLRRSAVAQSPQDQTAPPVPVRRRIFGVDTTVVRFNGAVFFVPDYAAHRPVAKKILERRLVSPMLHLFVGDVMRRQPGNMIHAGTFFGDMLPSFSRKTSGTVYAFEPVLENYLLAHAVIASNQLPNVMLMHAGLAAESGTAEVETQRGNKHYGGAARIVADPTRKPVRRQKVPLLTIDQFAIESLTLLQLDVEGFERQVLLGAIQTIRAQQPVIVIEDLRGDCADLLGELGYTEIGRAGNDHVYMTDACSARLGGIGDLRGLTARPVGSDRL